MIRSEIVQILWLQKEDPVKILIPHPYLSEEDANASPSGASISAFNHVRALSRHCEVYMPAEEPADYRDNVHGIPPAFETIESSLQWFESQEFDAVLMFEPNLDDLAFFRHVCPAPIVIRLSCCFGRNREFLNQALSCYSLLRPYDALSPKSAWCAEELANTVFDASYLRPITNGVDLEAFQSSDKPTARKEVAEATGDQRFLEMPIVGFCSRFEPAKGAYPFLRVADLNPDVLFAIVGQQFAPVAHPTNVVFLGHQPYDRMPLYYNVLDVLCSLSVYSQESCPSAILEGMACGLPIVATRFAGAPKLLSDCGRMIEVTRFENEPLDISGYVDPEVVSSSIRDLIDSKTGREELGRQARERAEAFSWDRIGRQHIELIEELQEKREQGNHPVPLTVHFAQGYDAKGNIHSIPKAFNYLGSQQGPLPRIPFLHQDLSSLEGLGLFLSQVLHPNEVEAALLGVTGDREACHRALRKIRQVGDMLIAP